MLNNSAHRGEIFQILFVCCWLSVVGRLVIGGLKPTATIASCFARVFVYPGGERTHLACRVRRPRRTHGPVGGSPTGAADPSSVAVLRREAAAALPTLNTDPSFDGSRFA